MDTVPYLYGLPGTVNQLKIAIKERDARHPTVTAPTGFLRCPPDATNNQAITQQEKVYPAQQQAMEVSMKAVMGLSLNCVRCHSHKYDPIPDGTIRPARAARGRQQLRFARATRFPAGLRPATSIGGNRDAA